MRKRMVVATGLVLALALALPAVAQESATLVLRSGERISGLLVDLGGVGFTIQVGGQNRQIATNEVAAIEFTAGAPGAEVRSKLKAGQAVVVLRNGQIVDGRLHDVSGTSPLRLSVDTASGSREFTSSDVAQVFLAYAAAYDTPAASGPAPAQPGSGVRVEASRPWVPTGITVRRGDRVYFGATGDIMVGPGASAGPAGSPIMNSPNYPVAGAAGGALIAKVGDNGQPFLVGSNTQAMTMQADGELILGINDDGFNDNTGFFTVTVTPQPAGRGVIRRR